MAKAAKEVNVKHFVWSTLPNCKEESGGKYVVPHFDGKAAVNERVTEQGFQYHTFV